MLNQPVQRGGHILVRLRCNSLRRWRATMFTYDTDKFEHQTQIPHGLLQQMSAILRCFG